MNIYLNPAPEQWQELCRRAEQDNSLIAERVETIVERVREQGDEAIKALAEQIDGVCLSSLKVQEPEFAAAEKAAFVPPADADPGRRHQRLRRSVVFGAGAAV